MSNRGQTEDLRLAVMQFIRTMGLLQVRETPCGQPLSVAQAHTLLFLRGRTADPMGPSQQAIAEHLKVDKSTVTRLLRRMSEQGLVQLVNCPIDKRAKRVSLTEQGLRMGNQVREASLAMFAQVVSTLPSDDDCSHITTALHQLNRAIAQSRPGDV